MIIALAGRRVDASDAKKSRFPATPKNIRIVRERIRALLNAQGATAMISSAACGADLLALAEAGNLGLRRKVVLPFDRERFRATSVTDRPGEWGRLYDSILDRVEKNADLLVMRLNSEEQAYAETNRMILDEALSMGRQLKSPVTAVLVWDGKSRGAGDLTAKFGVDARSKSIPVIEVMTL
jgi:hypothetical protein